MNKKIVICLLKKYTIDILNCIDKKALTVDEISNKDGIPIATVHRRMKELRELKLVEIVGKKMLSNGKRGFAYYSVLESLWLKWALGEMKLEMEYRRKPEEFVGLYVHQYNSKGSD